MLGITVNEVRALRSSSSKAWQESCRSQPDQVSVHLALQWFTLRSAAEQCTQRPSAPPCLLRISWTCRPRQACTLNHKPTPTVLSRVLGPIPPPNIAASIEPGCCAGMGQCATSMFEAAKHLTCRNHCAMKSSP